MRAYCRNKHGLKVYLCTALVFMLFTQEKLYGEDINCCDDFEFVVDEKTESKDDKKSGMLSKEEPVDSYWNDNSSREPLFRQANYGSSYEQEQVFEQEEVSEYDGYYYPTDDYWVRAEALLWWGKGMAVPPLVTTSTVGTAQAQAGVLGLSTTSVVFGDGNIANDERWGGRIRFGKWLDDCRMNSIEGEYFSTGEASTRFSMTSTGTPILARPFFNVLTSLQDAELVAYPGFVTGTVSVDAKSNLQSAGVRYNLYHCESNMGYQGSGPLGNFFSDSDYQVKFLAGYRYMRLDESLLIREELTTVGMPITDFSISDSFDTESHFHGGEFGMMWEFMKNNWTLDVLAKLAMGNSRQIVTISGATATTVSMVTTNASGGILAQRTNSGRHVTDKFAVVPELGLTLGCQLTESWKATFGYSFIYWSSVARPGEQIDTVVNPNLFPPEAMPFTGALRPAFNHRATDFWVQGINFGLEYTW